MRVYKIQSTKSKTSLYEGKYDSLIACLESAISQKIDLSFADLRKQNLNNANLDDARMTYADLTGANLTGANLSEARLLGSNFTNSTLFNACLAYSDLQHCDFHYTRFGATDITGSQLSFSRFSGQSCYSLNFIDCASMHSCRFIDKNGKSRLTSTPPVVVTGIKSRPFILMEDAKKPITRPLTA